MATEENEDLKLTEQQDGSVVVGDEPPPQEEDTGEDESLKANDDSHGDEEGHAEESAEEAEARKERNRQRRKESKERRNEYVEGLKRQIAARDAELQAMNERLSVVERKSSGSEMAQLDHAEKEAAQYYNHFKALNQQAIEQANGAVATDAQEKMFAAAQRLQQIKNIRAAMSQRQQQPAPLDPRLQSHAEGWMEKNNWYDPSGKDEDSSMVLAIDSRLAQEGWNPTTPHYWEELQRRVDKFLPHKANSGYNRPQGQRSAPRVPVAGSGRESASSNTNGSYRLSAERVQALKEAGLWDDPKQRADMVKRYQQLDKEARQ